jgi:hypothetical protein
MFFSSLAVHTFLICFWLLTRCANGGNRRGRVRLCQA